MDEKFLEQFYEAVVLPRYLGIVKFGSITWEGHGKVGLDNWAHHFASEGKHYTLLYEDYPDGAYFSDGLSHEMIELGEKGSIELKFTDGGKQIPNLLGWYTLYREIER